MRRSLITRQEVSINVQSRVDAMDLAELAEYYEENVGRIRSMSGLVAWAVSNFRNLLEKNGLIKEVGDIEEACEVLSEYRLISRNLGGGIDRGRHSKLMTALRVNSLRNSGEVVERSNDYKLLHNRHSVQPPEEMKGLEDLDIGTNDGGVDDKDEDYMSKMRRLTPAERAHNKELAKKLAQQMEKDDDEEREKRWKELAYKRTDTSPVVEVEPSNRGFITAEMVEMYAERDRIHNEQVEREAVREKLLKKAIGVQEAERIAELAKPKKLSCSTKKERGGNDGSRIYVVDGREVSKEEFDMYEIVR